MTRERSSVLCERSEKPASASKVTSSDPGSAPYPSISRWRSACCWVNPARNLSSMALSSSSSPLPRPAARSWMCCVVHLAEVLFRHERVDLRRGDACMTQELLDHPYVGSPLEEMRRERVSQVVGRHATPDPGTGGIDSQELRARLSREAAAPRVEEQRTTGPLAHESRPRAAEIRTHRLLRVTADRYLSFLPALPHDAHGSALQVEVVDVEPRELRDAQTGTVEDLEDRAITEPGRRGAVGRLDEAPDLVQAEWMGKRARHPRSHDLAGGVLRRDALAEEEAMERPNGREDARHGRRFVRGFLRPVRGSRHRRDESPDGAVVHLFGPHDPASRQEGH